MSNLQVSRIAFGAMGVGSPKWRPWVLDERHATPILERALDLGITFFDTSDYYSLGESEAVLGRVLGGLADREDVVIATKFGNQMGSAPTRGGFSRKHILAAVDESLRRLGVEYIDLYQTHIWRPETNLDELLGALCSLVEAGKIRYYGTTDIPVWQLAKMHFTALHRGWPSPTTVQHHYNLVWREHESELMPMCEAEGIGLLPYSPLARGFLSGGPTGHDRPTERGRTDEYSRGWYGRESDQAVLAAVNDVAAKRDASAAAIALAWVLTKHPTSVPIIGATSVEQLDLAEEALAITLEPDEVARLEQPYVARLRYGH